MTAIQRRAAAGRQFGNLETLLGPQFGKNYLQNLIMPEPGLEPGRVSPTVFKTVASAIPPLRQEGHPDDRLASRARRLSARWASSDSTSEPQNPRHRHAPPCPPPPEGLRPADRAPRL